MKFVYITLLAVVCLFAVGAPVHAALIPSAGSLSSTELSGLNAYFTDITAIATWMVTAVISVIGVGLLFKSARKIWRKFNA